MNVECVYMYIYMYMYINMECIVYMYNISTDH